MISIKAKQRRSVERQSAFFVIIDSIHSAQRRSHEEFEELEKGLIQRADALNKFLLDIYTEQKIIKDGLIPEEFIFSSPGFLYQCQNIVPPKNIFAHIAGIDLVKGKDGI